MGSRRSVVVDASGCCTSVFAVTAGSVAKGRSAVDFGEASATTSGSSTGSMDTVVCDRPTCPLTAVSGVRADPAASWTLLPVRRESLDRFVSTGGVTSAGRDGSMLRPAAALGASVSDASERCSADGGPDMVEVDFEPLGGSESVTTSGGDVGGFAADDPVDDPVDCDDPADDLVDESAAVDDVTDVDELAEEPPLTAVDVDESPRLGAVDVDESVEIDLADDDPDPDPPEGSADATAWPTTTAAPSPKATASPTIRPAIVSTPMGDQRTRAFPAPEQIAQTASSRITTVKLDLRLGRCLGGVRDGNDPTVTGVQANISADAHLMHEEKPAKEITRI